MHNISRSPVYAARLVVPKGGGQEKRGATIFESGTEYWRFGIQAANLGVRLIERNGT